MLDSPLPKRQLALALGDAATVSAVAPPPLTNDDVNAAFGPNGGICQEAGGTIAYDDTSYRAARGAILARLLASDQNFGAADDKSTFDLSPLDGVRQAIGDVFRSAFSDDPGSANLGRFRCALIVATAHVTRRDTPQVILCLFLALMERHWEQIKEETPAYVNPAEQDLSSAAAQYLLRCLAVQAAYDNFATYLYVLEQFQRVIVAIKRANLERQPDKMLDYLLYPSLRQLVVGVTVDAPVAAAEADARALGAWLARRAGNKGPCVVLAAVRNSVGFTVEGAAAAGGRVIWIRAAAPGHAGWDMSDTTLTLRVPTEDIDDVLLKSLCDVWMAPSDFSVDAKRAASLDEAKEKATQPSVLAFTLARCLEATGASDADIRHAVRGLDQALQYFLAYGPLPR